jgi:hypothetical protein
VVPYIFAFLFLSLFFFISKARYAVPLGIENSTKQNKIGKTEKQSIPTVTDQRKSSRHD